MAIERKWKAGKFMKQTLPAHVKCKNVKRRSPERTDNNKVESIRFAEIKKSTEDYRSYSPTRNRLLDTALQRAGDVQSLLLSTRQEINFGEYENALNALVACERELKHLICYINNAKRI
jgi:hypothetical protein